MQDEALTLRSLNYPRVEDNSCLVLHQLEKEVEPEFLVLRLETLSELTVFPSWFQI